MYKIAYLDIIKPDIYIHKTPIKLPPLTNEQLCNWVCNPNNVNTSVFSTNMCVLYLTLSTCVPLNQSPFQYTLVKGHLVLNETALQKLCVYYSLLMRGVSFLTTHPYVFAKHPVTCLPYVGRVYPCNAKLPNVLTYYYHYINMCITALFQTIRCS